MYSVKDIGGGREQGTSVCPAHSEHFRSTDTSEFKNKCLPVSFHVKCTIHRLTFQGRLSNWSPQSFPILFPTTPLYRSCSSSASWGPEDSCPSPLLSLTLFLPAWTPATLSCSMSIANLSSLWPRGELFYNQTFFQPLYLEVKSFSFEFLYNNYMYSSIHIQAHTAF